MLRIRAVGRIACTNAVLGLTLALAVILVFFLGAGHYGANATLIHWGGYLGIAASA